MLFTVEELGLCLSALLSLAEPHGLGGSCVQSEDAPCLTASWVRKRMLRWHWHTLFQSPTANPCP